MDVKQEKTMKALKQIEQKLWEPALRLGLQFFAEGDGEGGEGSQSGDAGEGGEGGKAGGEGGDKKFSQADIDKAIQKRLAEEKKKHEKALADAKTEAEKLAKMNADEKAEHERQKREKALLDREAEITKRELKAQAYETLAEKNIPKELADVLNYSDADACKASIEAVEKAFQSAVEKAVNEKLRSNNPPNSGRTPNVKGQPATLNDAVRMHLTNNKN